jgi:serine/threonine protein kinase
MELVEGYTLNRILQLHQQPLPLNVALSIVLEVANALRYVHEICMHDENKKIIHTDVSLQNIMVHKDSLVTKLNDFGFAKVLNRDDVCPIGEQIIGNPYYISPEHSMGEWVDQRSDMYSLGIVFFDLLVNRRTFDEPILSIAEKAREGNSIDRSLLEDIDAIVAGVIRKMLMVDPSERFQNSSELVKALEDLTAKVPDYPALLQDKRRLFESINQAAAAMDEDLKRTGHSAKTDDNLKTRVLPPPQKRETKQIRSDNTVLIALPRDKEKGQGMRSRPLPPRSHQPSLRPRKALFGAGAVILAAMAVLVTILQLRITRTDIAESKPVAPAMPLEASTPPAVTTTDSVKKFPLSVTATPWGMVRIVNREGVSVLAKEFEYTPLKKELEKGTYKVTIKHPRFGSKVFDLTIIDDRESYQIDHRF